MKEEKNCEEFILLIEKLANSEDFQKTKYISHHGMTRYDHSIRVAYYTYRITKTLRLNYKEATQAALLHDFFFDDVVNESKYKKLIHHPKYAVENAKKYINLTDLQKDIIEKHMFPITIVPPKYLESWIVDIADDIAAIYEKTYSVREEVTTVATFFFILIINILKVR